MASNDNPPHAAAAQRIADELEHTLQLHPRLRNRALREIASRALRLHNLELCPSLTTREWIEALRAY